MVNSRWAVGRRRNEGKEKDERTRVLEEEAGRERERRERGVKWARGV